MYNYFSILVNSSMQPSGIELSPFLNPPKYDSKANTAMKKLICL